MCNSLFGDSIPACGRPCLSIRQHARSRRAAFGHISRCSATVMRRDRRDLFHVRFHVDGAALPGKRVWSRILRECRHAQPHANDKRSGRVQTHTARLEANADVCARATRPTAHAAYMTHTHAYHRAALPARCAPSRRTPPARCWPLRPPRPPARHSNALLAAVLLLPLRPRRRPQCTGRRRHRRPRLPAARRQAACSTCRAGC